MVIFNYMSLSDKLRKIVEEKKHKEASEKHWMLERLVDQRTLSLESFLVELARQGITQYVVHESVELTHQLLQTDLRYGVVVETDEPGNRLIGYSKLLYERLISMGLNVKLVSDTDQCRMVI